jgi:cellulose synthase/poly-beta-1,6-N-acetylglucosamine synthase-like glycosyltransferase
MLTAVVALLTLAFFLAFGLELAGAARSIRRLSDLPAEGTEWPLVSVIIPALNEERNIEQALTSVMGLDYPALEVVFVNDRSTDRTGEVVARLAARDPRIHLVNIASLPAGWLGKNHALHVGAAEAGGELLLFTDADIVFEPSSLRRAVAYMEKEKLDHLTAGAEVTGPTFPLRLFISTFAFFFLMYARPWKAKDSNPRNHVGIGAFNLVRASLYRKAGGHEPIRMRPDDDMKLGKLVKLNGGREEFVGASGLISVEWYGSIGEAVRGLEKNAFSGVNYSVVLLILASIVQLTFDVWPWIALFVTHGWVRWVNASIILATLTMVAALARENGGRIWYALAFPCMAVFFLYVLWRSALIAIIRGGIDWRGTRYPLRDLRANKI